MKARCEEKTRNRTVILQGLILLIMLVVLLGHVQSAHAFGKSFLSSPKAKFTGTQTANCPSGMSHYWKLDENTAPFTDAYGTDAVCTNCPDAATGIINGAQHFNTTSQVNVADDNTFNWSSTSSFSIEFWMKTDSGSTCAGNQVIVGRKNSPTGLLWVGCADGGSAEFDLTDKSGNGAGVTGTKDLTDGNWHHVAAIRDASANQIRIYVDGILENSEPATFTSGFDFSESLNIGWVNKDSGFHFAGTIDEVAIYDGALSDIEIRSHYYVMRGYCDMCATAVTIMPLGDSITQGYNGEITVETYMASYRQKLYADLTGSGYNVDFVGSLQAGNSLIPSFDIDHEGHAGYTAAACSSGGYGDLVSNVYNWLTANPADIVLLHIGTNDIVNNCQSVDGVSSVLDEIYRYNSDITVLLARIINQKTYSQTVTDFNDGIGEMAQTRIANGDKIMIVDQEHALTYPNDMVGLLHPTQAGYDKMAIPWFMALRDFLPECNQAAPLIFSTPVTSVPAGKPYLYDVDATGNPLPAYNLNTAPLWMTINTNTGLISGTPNATGAFDVTVAAGNSVGTAVQNYSVQVVSCPSGMTHYWRFDEISPPYVDFFGAD
ncbi:MAG: LamG-like jellyroll fold domain-containing protein, partial [Thermodesulfovibrionales bacterium]